MARSCCTLQQPELCHAQRCRVCIEYPSIFRSRGSNIITDINSGKLSKTTRTAWCYVLWGFVPGCGSGMITIACEENYSDGVCQGSFSERVIIDSLRAQIGMNRLRYATYWQPRTHLHEDRNFHSSRFSLSAIKTTLEAHGATTAGLAILRVRVHAIVMLLRCANSPSIVHCYAVAQFSVPTCSEDGAQRETLIREADHDTCRRLSSPADDRGSREARGCRAIHAGRKSYVYVCVLDEDEDGME